MFKSVGAKRDLLVIPSVVDELRMRLLLLRARKRRPTASTHNTQTVADSQRDIPVGRTEQTRLRCQETDTDDALCPALWW
jgi:hypothetical protein